MNGTDELSPSTFGNRKTESYYNNDKEQKTQRTEERIFRITAKVLKKIQEESYFFDHTAGSCQEEDTIALPKLLPYFSAKEIKIGKFLGAGEFGVVHEVASLSTTHGCDCNDTRTMANGTSDGSGRSGLTTTGMPSLSSTAEKGSEWSYSDQTNNTCTALIAAAPEIDKDNPARSDDNANDEEKEHHNNEVIQELRHYVVNHVNRHGCCRYAVKHLKSDLIHVAQDDKECEDSALEAAVDLACEARYLANLHHPNIVHIRGIVGCPGRFDFGIIMDQLQGTLRENIIQWRNSLNRPQGKGLFGKLRKSLSSRIATTFSTSSLEHTCLSERLLAMYDIARAMLYLHKRRLLFRDLKAENCGVTVRGDIRLFDFGLSKELRKQDLVKEPDDYDATGMTGSRRYAAPEVIWCKNYGFSADVYSFGILLWEVVTMKQAFPDMARDDHFKKVVLHGKRPNIRFTKGVLSKQLGSLITDCWSGDRDKRPQFKAICEQLQMEITSRYESNMDGHGSNSLLDRSRYLMEKSDKSRLGEEG